jgi:hypothetical protein
VQAGGEVVITADNITDAQIRELREWARRRDVRDFEALTEANIALGMYPDWYSGRYRAKARARCAEILNARAAKP